MFKRLVQYHEDRQVPDDAKRWKKNCAEQKHTGRRSELPTTFLVLPKKYELYLHAIFLFQW